MPTGFCSRNRFLYFNKTAKIQIIKYYPHRLKSELGGKRISQLSKSLAGPHCQNQLTHVPVLLLQNLVLGLFWLCYGLDRCSNTSAASSPLTGHCNSSRCSLCPIPLTLLPSLPSLRHFETAGDLFLSSRNLHIPKQQQNLYPKLSVLLLLLKLHFDSYFVPFLVVLFADKQSKGSCIHFINVLQSGFQFYCK